MVFPEQVRAARALLKIDQATLAERAGVSIETVKRFERSDGQLKAQESTIASIGGALEKSGIVFIAANEKSLAGGVGVRFAERVEADEWNRKVDEVLSNIPLALRKSDYAEIAAAFDEEGKGVISIDRLEAVIADFLERAEKRLLRHSDPDGALLDLMAPPEDE